MFSAVSQPATPQRHAIASTQESMHDNGHRTAVHFLSRLLVVICIPLSSLARMVVPELLLRRPPGFLGARSRVPPATGATLPAGGRKKIPHCWSIHVTGIHHVKMKNKSSGANHHKSGAALLKSKSTYARSSLQVLIDDKTFLQVKTTAREQHPQPWRLRCTPTRASSAATL